MSRQCAHRWVNRFDNEGEEGLHERSSRPQTSPAQTAPDVEEEVLASRREHRRGPDWLTFECDVPARTITRILRRNGVPRLCECDPLTGEVIRSSKTTAIRYERDRPGELVHMDVKKLGKIPDGGGWKAHGRQMGSTGAKKRAKIGFDFVHSLVDDYSTPRVLRNPRRRERRNLRRFPRACRRTLRRTRHHHHRTSDDRQPLELPPQPSSRRRHRIPRSDPQVHQTALPLANGKVERFNRTLHSEHGEPSGVDVLVGYAGRPLSCWVAQGCVDDVDARRRGRSR